MKNLLYKELKLVIPPATYLFALLPALLLIPAYPYFVGVSYFFFIIQITFATARANKDHEFTSMLPIPRRQIVLAKHLNVAFVELLTILVAIPFALISSLIINPNGNIVGMDANFAFFGLTLIAYSVFNLAFFPAYFKTGYKMGVPLLIGIAVYLITICFFELVINLVPALKSTLDGLNPQTFIYQFIVLAAGIVIYVGSMFVSYKISTKKFEKVSL